MLAVHDSPPLTHEPAVQIGCVLMTDRKDAAIAVDIAHCAADLSAPDPVSKRQRCLLSASPALAFGRGAKLPAFRDIDPMQPDALPSDFQFVAVDHAGNAGQEIGIGVGGGKKGEQKESEKSAQWAGRLLAKVTSRTLTMPPAHRRESGQIEPPQQSNPSRFPCAHQLVWARSAT